MSDWQRMAFASTLQKMSRPAILAIVVLRVTGQNSMHDPPNVIRHPLDQKMNMICHQTERVEKKKAASPSERRAERETFCGLRVNEIYRADRLRA